MASPEDIDTVLTDGLGMRYSILGPFEAIHLNANGAFCLYSLSGCAVMCMLILLWLCLALFLCVGMQVLETIVNAMGRTFRGYVRNKEDQDR